MAALVHHSGDVVCKMWTRKDELDARVLKHLLCTWLCTGLIERYKVVSSPDDSELARDGGQGIIEAQADPGTTAGGMGDQTRDPISHVDELGIRHRASTGQIGLIRIHPFDGLICTEPKQGLARPGHRRIRRHGSRHSPKGVGFPN